MANENMQMSAAGYAALRLNEGVVMRYYNDAPRNGNCTYGVGTLVHMGPCTATEFNRPVPAELVNLSLHQRVQEAERIVRSIVREHELTQSQFDAAVSFAYNSRVRNTREALTPANRGDMDAVAQHFMRNVYLVPRDRRGRELGNRQLSQGLINRRRRESAPFRQQQPQAQPRQQQQGNR